MREGEFDIFHPTYFDPYLLPELRKPMVLTVHDMTYEALPECFSPGDPLPLYKRLCLEKADHVIAISEATRSDILRYSDIKEERLTVIHHGISEEPLDFSDVPELPAKYLLYVGARWSYKNFFLLAEAFAQVSRKHEDLYLVLAGGGPLAFGDTEFLRRHNILSKTLQLNLTDAQLNTVYKHAAAFIYPSRYEGFGFPILEAFKCGCPVLLSETACFREVAGPEAALYFDDHSLDELAKAIEVVLDSVELRERLIEAGDRRWKAFSLRTSIERTLNLYRSLT